MPLTAPLKNRYKLAKSLPLLAVAARLSAVRNWRFFIIMGGLKAHRHSLAVAARLLEDTKGTHADRRHYCVSS
jgi:hypothetical protein